jgi:hypothetical protein
VYWPYAYSDVFYYSFWPRAYAPGYWAYAYDDFFDGIFFPYGAPYTEYAYAGPYGAAPRGRSTSGSTSDVPGEVGKSVQRLCSQPANGVMAWPFDRISKAVDPTDDQQALLKELRHAADEAADRFKQACPEHVPQTPVGRLDAMTERLQATLDAVKLVRPPLDRFYQSLSDEQKARFNNIGPNLGRKQPKANDAATQAQAGCGGEKAGITAVPIERIEDEVNPTQEQGNRLDKLNTALEQAADTLQQACPDYIPRTPVGRLEVMQKRLEAMLAAAKTVRPALEDFYASLDSEQKARFNRLRPDEKDKEKRTERKPDHKSARHVPHVPHARTVLRHLMHEFLR